MISADRPPQLQDSGAPQTMPQAGIFAAFCAAQCDLGLPSLNGAEQAQRELHRALSAGLGNCGPVHINVPFDEPLIDADGDAPPTLAPLANRNWQSRHIFNECLAKRPGNGRRRPARRRGHRPRQPLPRATLKYLRGQGLADHRRRQRRSALVGPADPGLRRGFAAEPRRASPRTVGQARPDYTRRAASHRPAGLGMAAGQSCAVLRFDRKTVTKDFCHDSFTFPGPMAALGEDDQGKLNASIPSQNSSWTAAWQEAEAKAQSFHRALAGRRNRNCTSSAPRR